MQIAKQLTLAAAILAGSVIAATPADNYPNKPIKIVVPFGAGGSTDLTIRTIGNKITAPLGQPIIVENRPGAGGEIGINSVLSASPDGYTFLTTPSGPISVSKHLRKISYNPEKDLVPTAMLVRIPTAIAVNASLPVHSVKDLVEYTKKQDKPVSYGVSGVGTHMHLAGEVFKKRTGARLAVVPYNGAASTVLALSTGEVSVAFADLAALLPRAKAGSVRVIALVDSERVPMAKEIPTIGETLSGYGIDAWLGVFAKSGTPEAAVARINKEISAALALPEIVENFSKAGLVPWTMSAGEMKSFIQRDIQRLGTMIEEAQIKIE